MLKENNDIIELTPEMEAEFSNGLGDDEEEEDDINGRQ